LVINQVDKKVNFRVLLLPFKMGDALPEIKFENNKTLLNWTDYQKEILFKRNLKD